MELFFGGSSGHLLADRRYDSALQYAQDGDMEAALDLIRQGLEMAPDWPPFHFHLGEFLWKKGENREAIASLLKYLVMDPQDKMGATVKLVLLGALPLPKTLPPSYVQSLFDQYAPRFDKVLVEDLDYRTPRFLSSAVQKITNKKFNRVLDLGCGTGLAAAQFKKHADWIEGVDLSSAMIGQAKKKEFFHALHVDTIEDFLAEPREPYDLILCADVFVYIGALEKIFTAVSAQMTDDGLFAFSVQGLSSGTWKLRQDHRYSHSQDYIESCAKGVGWNILSCENVVLRKDADLPVMGMVFVCGK